MQESSLSSCRKHFPLHFTLLLPLYSLFPFKNKSEPCNLPAFWIALDGTVTYITEGQLKAISCKIADQDALSYDLGPVLHSFKRAHALLVVPREKFSLVFNLHSVAALIKKGYRIRLVISRRISIRSSLFHMYQNALRFIKVGAK